AFSTDFSASPARKRQVWEALRRTVSPVRGLRAVPAGRLIGTKLPKPTTRASFPALSEVETEEMKASSASLAWALFRPDLSAMASTSSAFVMSRLSHRILVAGGRAPKTPLILVLI